MASILTTSSKNPQQPPTYILQGWHREQTTTHEQYLLQQTFAIAPDGAIPFSKFRQRLRNIYDERAKLLIVGRYDPWEKKTKIIPTQDFVKGHTNL